jgi:hypothetical protein
MIVNSACKVISLGVVAVGFLFARNTAAGEQLVAGAECLPTSSSTSYVVDAGRITNKSSAEAWFVCPIHHTFNEGSGGIYGDGYSFNSRSGTASVYYRNGGSLILCYPALVIADNSRLWGDLGTLNPTNPNRVDFPASAFPVAPSNSDRQSQYAIQCLLPPNARIDLIKTSAPR